MISSQSKLMADSKEQLSQSHCSVCISVQVEPVYFNLIGTRKMSHLEFARTSRSAFELLMEIIIYWISIFVVYYFSICNFCSYILNKNNRKSKKGRTCIQPGLYNYYYYFYKVHAHRK